VALDKLGRRDDAIQGLTALLRIYPEQFEPHMKLASLLRERGDLDAALPHYAKGVGLRPADRMARFDYAVALEEHGDAARAVAQYQQLLDEQSGDFPLIAARMAWLLATRAREPEAHQAAMAFADAAIMRGGRNNPICLRAKAAALAAINDFATAEAIAKEALAVDTQNANTALTEALRADVQRYQKGLNSAKAGPLIP
jgi:tetratricopeptide (TPR) repeat protein